MHDEDWYTIRECVAFTGRTTRKLGILRQRGFLVWQIKYGRIVIHPISAMLFRTRKDQPVIQTTAQLTLANLRMMNRSRINSQTQLTPEVEAVCLAFDTKLKQLRGELALADGKYDGE